MSGRPPIDEIRRQNALDSLEVLDTPADPHLDTLVRLARESFGVSAVLISLIDHDRQWFKARNGLELSETPRQISFCSHAIEREEMLVVEDARLHPCFCDNPIVTGPPYLRFYAGQPLCDDGDQPIGTFCLLDFHHPRTLSETERARLRDFAYLAMGYLKINAMSRQAEELRQALTRAQRKAMLDPLTQVWNRAGLDHLLPREQAAVKAKGLQLGLLICDIDHFKAVNDSHGHACGDQALWEAARRLRRQSATERSGGAHRRRGVRGPCPGQQRRGIGAHRRAGAAQHGRQSGAHRTGRAAAEPEHRQHPAARGRRPGQRLGPRRPRAVPGQTPGPQPGDARLDRGARCPPGPRASTRLEPRSGMRGLPMHAAELPARSRRCLDAAARAA